MIIIINLKIIHNTAETTLTTNSSGIFMEVSRRDIRTFCGTLK